MKKKIKDVTFKEFNKWVNDRACDGAWSMFLAMNCIKATKKVLAVKPLFGREKTREKEWERIKSEYFNLDVEIEV